MSARMQLRATLELEGRLEIHVVESGILRDNPLGDPAARELPLYVPPVDDPANLPVIFVLSGFTGRGQGQLETHPWKRGLVARYDAAVSAGELPPAILALPDCFTRLGGSQYVNSPAVGRYEDHVADELVPFVEALHPHGPARRGFAGKSSGGFGALHLALTRPGLFAACASISGDVGFEAAFAHELLCCARGLIPHESDPRRFLDAFERDPRLEGDAHAVISVLAMSACYSPSASSPLGFDLPIDLETAERRPDVWRRWLAFDPLERVESGAEALKRLAFLHLECGLKDEFHLQWGLRRLVRKLAALGVPYSHEEHEKGHFDLGARDLPVLGRMATALAP